MPLAALGALPLMAGIGAVGSVAGAVIGSNAAGNAADTQAAAANHSADLQYQASQNSLNFEKQQWGQTQANEAPFIQSGAGALGNLNYLLGLQNPNTQGTMTGGPLTPYSGTQQPGGTASPLQRTGAPVGPVASGGPAMPTARAMGQPLGVNTQGTTMPANGAPVAGTNGPAQFGAPGVGYPPARAGASTNFGATTGGTGGQAVPGASGTTDLGSTVNPSNGGFGSLMQGYQGHFTSPTALTEQNDPGYQARLQLGTDALQKSAAARGSVLTGGTAKALDTYAQDYASNEYGNVYNRAYNNYATDYNQFNQNQTNQYNRLASLAGVGQQTAQQLGTLGSQASNNVSQNLLSTAQGMGNAYQNAGNANASGIMNSASSINGGISGVLSSLNQYQQLQQLQNKNINPGTGGGALPTGWA